MLIQFTVGNYRSIAEPVTLSMVAAPTNSKSVPSFVDVENVVRIDDKLSLLKTIAIYGPNASGKSNVLSALTAMGSFMTGSANDIGKAGSIINDDAVLPPFEPFKLVTGYQDKPSHFEIVFLLNDAQYRYGFEVSAHRVEREWLFIKKDSIRETCFFERELQEYPRGNSLSKKKGIRSATNPRALYISVARILNNDVAKQIFAWVDRFPFLSGLSNVGSYTTIGNIRNNVNSEETLRLITSLDLAIEDIKITERERVVPENEQQSDGPKKTLYVHTVHKQFDQDGNYKTDVELNMRTQESSGTRKLFGLSGQIINCLKSGYVLAVDELDAKLHTAITKRLVQIFQDPLTNPRNVQLVFTTHDTNVLDRHLLRRDQIWFTEKQLNGSTDLYSLVEFSPRPDANFERDYIHGKYGAIPYGGGFDSLVIEDDRSKISAK